MDKDQKTGIVKVREKGKKYFPKSFTYNANEKGCGCGAKATDAAKIDENIKKRKSFL
jgi:hypothetical protein